MNNARKLFLCTLAATAALLPVGAGAADDMSAQMSQVAKIPCSQADAAMSQMMSTAMAPDVMKMSGHMDADYTRTMQIMSGTGLAMSMLEARCGSTPAARKKASDSVKALQPFYSGFTGTGIRGGY